MTSLSLFPVEWLTRDRNVDERDEHYCATAFARDADGRSVALHVDARLAVGIQGHHGRGLERRSKPVSVE